MQEKLRPLQNDVSVMSDLSDKEPNFRVCCGTWLVNGLPPLRLMFAEGTWGIQAPEPATPNWRKICGILDSFGKIMI